MVKSVATDRVCDLPWPFQAPSRLDLPVPPDEAVRLFDYTRSLVQGLDPQRSKYQIDVAVGG